jgi:hypothetical protein
LFSYYNYVINKFAAKIELPTNNLLDSDQSNLFPSNLNSGKTKIKWFNSEHIWQFDLIIIEILSINLFDIFFTWLENDTKSMFLNQKKFSTLNPYKIKLCLIKELKAKESEKIILLKQNQFLRSMNFNYSYIFFDVSYNSFCLPPEIIDTNSKKEDFDYKNRNWDCVADVDHHFQKLDIETKRIPSIPWFNTNKKDVVAYFMAYFKMDKRKTTKYINLKPKVNYNMHKIDQNRPDALINFFRHKYNKLYPKIEILCKFPELLFTDWMQIKLNNWQFHINCHHFSSWLENLFKCSNNMRFSNLCIESFRLVYHINYINKHYIILINEKKEMENIFRKMEINQVIKWDIFNWVNHPAARKTIKLVAFRKLLLEEHRVNLVRFYRKRRIMNRWKKSKLHNQQLIEEAKMKLLRLRSPFLLQPFDKEWQFNIWIIDFP